MAGIEGIVDSLRNYVVEQEYTKKPESIKCTVSKSTLLQRWSVKLDYMDAVDRQSTLQAIVYKPLGAYFGSPWKAVINVDDRPVYLNVEQNSVKGCKERGSSGFFGGSEDLDEMYRLMPSAKTNLLLNFLMGAEHALQETGLAKNLFTNLDVSAAETAVGAGVVVAVTATVLFPPGRYVGESLAMKYVKESLAMHDPINKVKAIKEEKLKFLHSLPWKVRDEFEQYLRAWYYTGDTESNIFLTFAKHSESINSLIASSASDKAVGILNILFENNPPKREEDSYLYSLADRLLPIDSENAGAQVKSFVNCLRNENLIVKDDNLDCLVGMTKTVIKKSVSPKYDTMFSTYEEKLNDEVTKSVRSLRGDEIQKIKERSLHTMHRMFQAGLVSVASLVGLNYLSAPDSSWSAVLNPITWGALMGGKTIFDGILSGFYRRVDETYNLYVRRKQLELSPASPDQTMTEYQSLCSRRYDIGYSICAVAGISLSYAAITALASATWPVTLSNWLGVGGSILSYLVFLRFKKQAKAQKFAKR
ncbi:MAG: hypothetical protein HY363_06440 [Candidatus Aenigmarchaeota archaeon]|nr:hypothetical protein [Candidatus Aenigmarchaeota archaeon]